MRRQVSVLSFLLALAVTAAPMAMAQPQHVSYQGYLVSNGAAVTDVVDFAFAIVDAAGTTTLWSNDGSSTTGDKPATSMALNVDAGVFYVRLGDTSTGQVPLSAELLAGATDPLLRVWVDTGSGFEQLTDQPLSSNAFAIQADAARRALTDFDVPGTLSANTLLLPNSAGAGLVLTSDQNGLASWQPAQSGGEADNDWTLLNDDLIANVGGNVGIGTASPLQKLHVVGNSRFELASDRWIEASTPGGWPGFIAITPNTHRRDIIFDDSGMRLLAGDSANPPGPASGITIRENGWVGIGTQSPDALLHINGESRASEFRVTNSGWGDVFLSGDGSVGGFFELHGPNSPTDYGISMEGAGASSGGRIHVYNRDSAVTAELLGDAGDTGSQLTLGNGTTGTIFADGNSGGGGQLRATNGAGTLTYSVTGQAFSSGSQTRMYDGTGALAQEWTAANREWKSFNDNGDVLIRTAATSSGGEAFLYQQDGQNGIVLDGDSGGHGEMRVYDASGATRVHIIGQDFGGNGRVVTDILEIQGGSDLSESFDINGDVEVEPGMVVCIDPASTGQLVRSKRPYERTVAGIVSGAGGVKPGMLMGQKGSIADGRHPVALTGRVWTWCDASSDPIAPGDLLTTSATPGHAMTVGDHARANGAILGKAMSRLDEGRGLVLVLVSLQ